MGLSALIFGSYAVYRTYKHYSSNIGASLKDKSNKLSELDASDWQLLFTDMKYHLIKNILIRTVYHSYLKERCLLGDNMLNTTHEM